MRHSYIERPRRLPTARAVLRVRSRSAPIAIAVPLVAVLWLTIGLPILGDAIGAAGADRRTRNVVLEAAAGGGGSSSNGTSRGGPKGLGVAPPTEAVATFSPSVVRSAKRLGILAAEKLNGPGASPGLRDSAAAAPARYGSGDLTSPEAETGAPSVTLPPSSSTSPEPSPEQSTSPEPSPSSSPQPPPPTQPSPQPPPPPASAPPSPKPPPPPPTSPKPPPPPASAQPPPPGPSSESSSAPPAAPESPQLQPPPAPTPPGLPAPADVQTANSGKKLGKAQQEDRITFTFAGTLDASLILAGWNGSGTSVTVRIADNRRNDILTVRSASGAQLPLGSVQLDGDYAEDDVDFRGSTMTASGSTVTVVLGDPTHDDLEQVKKDKTTTMIWTTSTGTVTESGPGDVEF